MPSQIDLRGQPNAPSVLQETRKFFTRAQEQSPLDYELDSSERTVDGFIELGWEHLQLQRTLHLDFQHSIVDWDRERLENEAQTKILVMNASRDHQGVDRLEIGNIDGTLLRRLVEPSWIQEIKNPEFAETVKKYPEHVQANLQEFREVDSKLGVLSNDEELRKAANEKSHDEMQAIKAATAWIKTDISIDTCSKKISELYQIAAASARPLTKADKKRIERLELKQADLRSRQGNEITSPDMIEPTTKQIERLERRKRRREFEQGLVVTESMKQTISEVLPSLARGNPALFVGDTGGAKTALAEFIASEYIGKEAELISGYSDVNGYQLMGKTGLNSKDGVTVSEFIAGPVVRAMESGVPLILDEINAMPAEFMKRLNKILQLRPGDRMTIQEDSGREVIVQPGFCIMATANEKSKRYKGVDDLSSELQNRFAASTYRIRYPDYDTANGQVPKENLMIAVAALTDEIGEFAVDLPDKQLEQFVKIAHITQKLFSGEYGEAERAYVPTDRRADNAGYGLEEAVLAPRTMVAILDEVRASYGSITLEKVLNRWVDGVKNKSDKAVINAILNGNPLELPSS